MYSSNNIYYYGKGLTPLFEHNVAESMPGAIQIFARAIGKSEAELFKMMENGELLAKDVLPKVAIEMKKVAAVGLQQKLYTLRVAQGQFFNELDKSQNVVFESGFAEGLKDLFQTVTFYFRENQQTLKDFGAVFGFTFNAIEGFTKTVLPIISAFVRVIANGIEGINEMFGEDSAKMVAAWGTTLAIALSPITRIIAIISTIGDFFDSFFTPDKINLIEKMLGLDFDFSIKGLNEIINPFADQTGARAFAVKELEKASNTTTNQTTNNTFYIQSDEKEAIIQEIQTKIFSNNSSALLPTG